MTTVTVKGTPLYTRYIYMRNLASQQLLNILCAYWLHVSCRDSRELHCMVFINPFIYLFFKSTLILRSCVMCIGGRRRLCARSGPLILLWSPPLSFYIVSMQSKHTCHKLLPPLDQCDPKQKYYYKLAITYKLSATEYYVNKLVFLVWNYDFTLIWRIFIVWF